MIKNTWKYLPTIYSGFETSPEHRQVHNPYITRMLFVVSSQNWFQFIYSQELFLTKDRKFLFWQVKDKYKTRNNKTNLS